MSAKAIRHHIDSAGRLASIVTHLWGENCDQADVLAWCSEANILMTNDSQIPLEAMIQVMGGEEVQS